MLQLISSILNKNKRLAVGLMSGTSLDGIDAALVEIAGVGDQTSVQLVEFESLPYKVEERNRLIELCSPETSTVEKICEMNVELGERFAEAAISVIKKAGLKRADVDFISSHGQTIYHWPDNEATFQIGELAVITARTGILTVGDFRPNDMAYGGQGAPLVPFVDSMLFSHPDRNRVLINIGGISNLTIVPKRGKDAGDCTAFDIGPGNVLIDGVVRKLTNHKKSYDEGGSVAIKGKVHGDFLEELFNDDSFLKMHPPKSTGREHYNNQLLEKILKRSAERDVSFEDIVATVTHYTITSIVSSIREFVLPQLDVDEAIVSGGGAHNRAILDGLQQQLSCRVRKFDDIAFSGDAKEAVAFVVLGNQFLHGEPNNLPSATGAKREAVMGKLVLP
ncbi:anhydro-N-acetylmuramic acid kinase [Alkalihalobacillus sp. AL-G]|uniref:anhydro-N-acetylmuramic acid kinase n=1 Tax=Alkalihalobacillus sp. AL-G TaxID=2926399 RepID=UPI00272B311E|nr:anhydro-N-acetylmuramic acid kinase [Alkalihalobacillus sp. AL-G]WLD91928.1 anhydro-N-acetylmuramic acid kinase [Alkalihalobacillus sp. AL-G]